MKSIILAVFLFATMFASAQKKRADTVQAKIYTGPHETIVEDGWVVKYQYYDIDRSKWITIEGIDEKIAFKADKKTRIKVPFTAIVK